MTCDDLKICHAMAHSRSNQSVVPLPTPVSLALKFHHLPMLVPHELLQLFNRPALHVTQPWRCLLDAIAINHKPECGAMMATTPEKALMTLSLASPGRSGSAYCKRCTSRTWHRDCRPQSAISRNDVLRKRLALTRFYSHVNCRTGHSNVYISKGLAVC
jgi:hypothetical protein